MTQYPLYVQKQVVKKQRSREESFIRKSAPEPHICRLHACRQH